MPSLSIKNVPDSVVEKLRLRAAANHRSLQGELIALVCDAVDSEQSSSVPGYGQGATGWKSVGQIADEHRARGRPQADGPLAVDIIRAERDAR